MLKEIKEIESWIREVVKSAGASGVVIGMSGGKDSFVTAKLCADAVGKENVLGVIMPNGKMKDIDIAKQMCNEVGIKSHLLDISSVVNTVETLAKEPLLKEGKDAGEVSKINLPPRIRMTTLYFLAASMNYLVANTSNLSEAMVGYTTKWGDNVGDFSPLGDFTKTEVCEIGLALGLSEKLVNKVPDDGLSGKSDEEKLGVSYAEIDKMIRDGTSSQSEKILKLNRASVHKRNGAIKFDSKRTNHLK